MSATYFVHKPRPNKQPNPIRNPARESIKQFNQIQFDGNPMCPKRVHPFPFHFGCTNMHKCTSYVYVGVISSFLLIFTRDLVLDGC